MASDSVRSLVIRSWTRGHFRNRCGPVLVQGGEGTRASGTQAIRATRATRGIFRFRAHPTSAIRFRRNGVPSLVVATEASRIAAPRHRATYRE